MRSIHQRRLAIGAALLALLAALPAIGAGAEVNPQTALVRGRKDCWDEFRQRVNPDSAVVLRLGSDERLAVREWFVSGSSLRRTLAVRLAAESGDSSRLVPASEIRSFTYRKRVPVTIVPTLLASAAGMVAGGVLAGRGVDRSPQPRDLGDVVVDSVTRPVVKTLAVLGGAFLGGLVAGVVTHLLTPRTTRVVECACGPDSVQAGRRGR